ncbi:MAG: pseudouridine synthase [Candidatus Eutrophobiaceae bacterium]
MQKIGIQKRLAQAGYGSRRQIDAWLCAGLIQVNGKTAEPGQRIGLNDQVKLHGKSLRFAKRIETRVLAMHKVDGVICTRRDERGRPTVFDALPKISDGKWINIGRLDINTSGLLMFTNDGDLAQLCMHPSSMVEREYAIRVHGTVGKQAIRNMLEGVMIDKRISRFTDLVQAKAHSKGANQWFYAVLMSGRNREVRYLWESQGLSVSRLRRLRYGSYLLPRGKKPGSCWELDAATRKQWIEDIQSRLSASSSKPSPA